MTLTDYLKTTTQAAFAANLGVSQGLVSQWLAGKTAITMGRARQIVRTTGGAITPHDLMPDVFPAGFEFPPEPASEAAA